MGDVVFFCGDTKLDIPPERVLQEAAKLDLAAVVVIGIPKDEDGEPAHLGELYFASSTASAAVVNLLVDRAKRMIFTWL